MTSATALQPTSNAPALAPSFAVPFDQLAEFAVLAEARRSEIHYTLRVLSQLHLRVGEIGKMAALAEVAALHKHAMGGLSSVSLDRKYKAYLAHGWRSLVKGYKAPHQQPDAFIQEVRRVAELTAPRSRMNSGDRSHWASA